MNLLEKFLGTGLTDQELIPIFEEEKSPKEPSAALLSVLTEMFAESRRLLGQGHWIVRPSGQVIHQHFCSIVTFGYQTSFYHFLIKLSCTYCVYFLCKVDTKALKQTSSALMRKVGRSVCFSKSCLITSQLACFHFSN